MSTDSRPGDGGAESPFHGHSLSVTSFLGGITFAAMILLIQSRKDIAIPSEFPTFYLDLLITGTAITSVLFIVSSVGMIRIASGERKANEKFSKSMEVFAALGFYGLIALLPLLVLPFLWPGALAVGIVEGITIGIYAKYYLRKQISLQ